MSNQPKRKYDSTVARMAGNIMAGMVDKLQAHEKGIAVNTCVELARMIVAETIRTEPKEEA